MSCDVCSVVRVAVCVMRDVYRLCVLCFCVRDACRAFCVECAACGLLCMVHAFREMGDL